MIEGCNFHPGTCTGCNLLSLCYSVQHAEYSYYPIDDDYDFTDIEPLDLEVYFD